MRVAVVIPCYKVKKSITSVISKIGPEVEKIYVVDDKCPESTGDYVAESVKDPRLAILYHSENQGVGGAVMTGYLKAMQDKMDVVVKVDGDGQMDPALISNFITPIVTHQADYTKGNRFYRVDDVKKMPTVRLFGNAVLSFFSKISTGYWTLFDPTNGYTAISVKCLRNIDLEKVSKRYFFESDLLFRLSIVGANVRDVPMQALYGEEESNLVINKILFSFLCGHIRNFLKRILYDYFLRDFSIASISLIFGLGMFCFGLSFGVYHWFLAIQEHTVATSGTVMLAALPIIVGTQLILNFLNYDMNRSRSRHGATF